MNKFVGKIQNFALVFFSIPLITLTYLIPLKKNRWIFGSGKGFTFADNAAYFFKYLQNQSLVEHQEFIWISRNPEIINKLKFSGFRAYHNFSLSGIWYVITSKYYIFSTIRADILFFFKKKNRISVNVWHGMPLKKIIYDYEGESLKKNKVMTKLWNNFAVGFLWNEVDIIIATSSLYKSILTGAFRNKNVYITGQPRTDIFFQSSGDTPLTELRKSGKKIITYMPTHRNYGKGELNPVPFTENDEAITFLENQNIIVIYKFHPNMLSKHIDNSVNGKNIFCDFSRTKIDVQQILKETDILITDYSSCFIDFLLLDRPVIFYHYDDYEKIDNSLYYNLDKYPIGPIASNESDLLNMVKDAIQNPETNSQKRKMHQLEFNQFHDGKSSERLLKTILNITRN